MAAPQLSPGGLGVGVSVNYREQQPIELGGEEREDLVKVDEALASQPLKVCWFGFYLCFIAASEAEIQRSARTSAGWPYVK